MHQIFGLAQKIWTGTKHFGTCKRTRHKAERPKTKGSTNFFTCSSSDLLCKNDVANWQTTSKTFSSKVHMRSLLEPRDKGSLKRWVRCSKKSLELSNLESSTFSCNFRKCLTALDTAISSICNLLKALHSLLLRLSAFTNILA